MRTLVVATLLALGVPAVLDAQQQQQQQQQRRGSAGDQRNGPPTPEQRAEIEARVIQRSVQQFSTEVGLAPDVTRRLQEHLLESAVRRRELFLQTVDVRNRLVQATRQSGTTDAQFNRLLAEMTSLRDRELMFWRRDQHALTELLTPKQRAQFVVHWARLQDNVRDITERRPPQP